MIPAYQRALIVGAGNGLSASLARLLATEGLRVGLVARNADKLSELAAQIEAAVHAADASKPEEGRGFVRSDGPARPRAKHRP